MRFRQVQVAPAEPPNLLIAKTSPPGNDLLSWAQGAQTNMPTYQLQSRTNLSAGSWSNVTNPTNVLGTVRSVTLPASGKANFYHLRGN